MTVEAGQIRVLYACRIFVCNICTLWCTCNQNDTTSNVSCRQTGEQLSQQKGQQSCVSSSSPPSLRRPSRSPPWPRPTRRTARSCPRRTPSRSARQRRRRTRSAKITQNGQWVGGHNSYVDRAYDQTDPTAYWWADRRVPPARVATTSRSFSPPTAGGASGSSSRRRIGRAGFGWPASRIRLQAPGGSRSLLSVMELACTPRVRRSSAGREGRDRPRPRGERGRSGQSRPEITTDRSSAA